MNTLRICSEPAARPEDMGLIENAIDHYNITVTGRRDYYPIRIFLRLQDATIVGGILGHCWGGWLHITTLWIEESLRQHGYGSRLVRMAEAEARSYGCQAAYLETFSFQAPSFYEALGYEVIACVEDFPPGHRYCILKKTFETPGKGVLAELS